MTKQIKVEVRMPLMVGGIIILLAVAGDSNPTWLDGVIGFVGITVLTCSVGG